MSKVIVYDRQSFKEELKNFNFEEFSWDTETTSLRQDELEITGISMYDGNKALYAPINSEKNEKKVPCMEYYEMVKVLKDYQKEINGGLNIAHNWVFDARVMDKMGFDITRGKRACTMVLHHLINENSEHGLKYLVKNYL